MRIAITGASGFVGRQLVERLGTQGHQLLLVGRDADAIARQWPQHDTCSYANLAQRGQGCERLIHLAVLNNNVGADEAEFFRVNVDMALETLRQARRAGIPHFINISSLHALSDLPHPYARSKKAAAAALQAEGGVDVLTVYMPAVYGNSWAGRLAPLNRVPLPLARFALMVLSALQPVVHVDRLVTLCTEAKLPVGPIFLADDQDRNPVYRAGKRVMDVGFALTVLFLLWWALIGVWIAIRTQSRGPGIFAQPRVGRHRKVFICLKFRTMAVGTLQTGTHQVAKTAVTPLGNVLRRTKVDELPQIWNILRNEISLVGPRPCLTVQDELIAERDRHGVFAAKPGITGLAQVNNIDMSDPRRLAEWDARYLATRSLLLDFKILLRTALGSGQGDKVKVD